MSSFVLTWYIINKYKIEIQLLFISPDQRDVFFGTIQSYLQDFFTLALGVFVEALPFVVLGVAVSVLVQTYLPTQKLLDVLPRNRYVRRLIISCFGIAMPVCECGNVPVARSLMVRGFSVQEAIVFLLCAPSVNLITIIVTLEAFNFDKRVALVRVVATLIIANITAYLTVRILKSKKKILAESFTQHCDVQHKQKKSIKTALSLFQSEFWQILRMLVFGASVAALSQVFIPREILTSIASNPALAVFAMLGLAFVISICSTVDAFFALAYVNTFSLGAISAFLIAGPMVDIKMVALMKTTFTTQALICMIGLVAIGTACLTIGLSYVW